MTGVLTGIFNAFKKFVTPSNTPPSSDEVYYPSGRAHFGATSFFTNNNHTNLTAQRTHQPSTLQSSYYNSNNNWPHVPKPPSTNSNHFGPVAGATGGAGRLFNILENNNCRKRTADFAFKNYYPNQNSHHTTPFSFTARKNATELVQHLTDDEDEDIDFAKPTAKKFFSSFPKASNFYSFSNSRGANNSKGSGVAATSAINHTSFNNFNSSSTFGLGLAVPVPSLSASSALGMNRLTKFTTDPKYQKKIPRKEPECITISDDDDVDARESRTSRFETIPQSKSRPASRASMGIVSSTRPSFAKEFPHAPHLFSTKARISTPAYQKRTSMGGSSSNINSHLPAARSSYFPLKKEEIRQRSPLRTMVANHKSTNAYVNEKPSTLSSQIQSRGILFGDTDDDDSLSESGSAASEVVSMEEEEVVKVDRGCGPDEKEDPLKRRAELLFGKKPVVTPLNKVQSPSWRDQLLSRTRPNSLLSRASFGVTAQNGDIFAFGALMKSRSPSIISIDGVGNVNGDSNKATGSRGSSSSFTNSTMGRRDSEVSTPSGGKSPISMSTENDAKFYDDIQIVSENILSPPQRRNQFAVNSLELEMCKSEVKDKTWLVGKVQEYQDRQARNNSHIEYEKKKMDILKKESTLNTDIEERIRRQLTITDVITLEPVPPELPEISAEMQLVIDNALRLRNDTEVLVTAFNIQITRADLKTLMPCQWLNDNVINTYMDMIAQRSRNTSGLPSVHVYTTFFYPKLQREGYSNTLKRWTRKVDIFSFDLLVFPIHLGVHWCLAAADLRTKQITFFDSLLGNHLNALKDLLNYLAQEMNERKKQKMETSEWKLLVPSSIPTQENGSDCGVFTCKFAEYVSRDAQLTFKQKDMNYYRSRMVYEIIKQDLMYP